MENAIEVLRTSWARLKIRIDEITYQGKSEELASVVHKLRTTMAEYELAIKILSNYNGKGSKSNNQTIRT